MEQQRLNAIIYTSARGTITYGFQTNSTVSLHVIVGRLPSDPQIAFSRTATMRREVTEQLSGEPGRDGRTPKPRKRNSRAVGTRRGFAFYISHGSAIARWRTNTGAYFRGDRREQVGGAGWRSWTGATTS